MPTKSAVAPSHAAFLLDYKEKLRGAVESVNVADVGRAIAILESARNDGRTIFVCGNGGSASTASHFVCDMVKGASFKREARFRIMALTDGIPTITAYSNDVGYDCIFTEQLKNFARPGDVFISISGSGNSPNVVNAMKYADSLGCRTIALTGRDGGQLGPMAEVEIRVDAPHMGRIEDGHLIVCHMICYYFMESAEA
jgi:D-sedoheptulose 7-phosphate isomerase